MDIKVVTFEHRIIKSFKIVRAVYLPLDEGRQYTFRRFCIYNHVTRESVDRFQTCLYNIMKIDTEFVVTGIEF